MWREFVSLCLAEELTSTLISPQPTPFVGFSFPRVEFPEPPLYCLSTSVQPAAPIFPPLQLHPPLTCADSYRAESKGQQSSRVTKSTTKYSTGVARGGATAFTTATGAVATPPPLPPSARLPSQPPPPPPKTNSAHSPLTHYTPSFLLLSPYPVLGTTHRIHFYST